MIETLTSQWRYQRAVWWSSVCSLCTANSTGPSSADTKCSKQHLPQLCLQYTETQWDTLKHIQHTVQMKHSSGGKWGRGILSKFTKTVEFCCAQVAMLCYCMMILQGWEECNMSVLTWRIKLIEASCVKVNLSHDFSLTSSCLCRAAHSSAWLFLSHLVHTEVFPALWRNSRGQTVTCHSGPKEPQWAKQTCQPCPVSISNTH